MTTMSKLLTTSDICSIGEIGEVVWLECYFDGHTSLQPYMFDIGFTQKPVMINGNDNFYNLYESDVKDRIESAFGETWKDKRYRWWNSKPDDKTRENCNEWNYISAAPT